MVSFFYCNLFVVLPLPYFNRANMQYFVTLKTQIFLANKAVVVVTGIRKNDPFIFHFNTPKTTMLGCII